MHAPAHGGGAARGRLAADAAAGAARAAQARRAAVRGAARGAPRRKARHYRPLPCVLVSVAKRAWKRDGLEEEYATRLNRYAPFKEVRVKPNPKGAAGDVDAACEAEGARVARHLDELGYFVVLLDERGERATSEGLADMIADAGDRGERGVAFVLGGPFGHGEEAQKRAHKLLRLSDLVLNHEVARLVIVEALYRAHAILRGEPYHH